MSVKIVEYKFDNTIYENLIPEFNAEFTNYEIVDEYLDTEDITTTSTETTLLFNNDSEPDEYGVLTTEYEIENVNTFSAENIVTRSIYSTELPTLMRFGVTDDSITNRELSLLNILNINSSNITNINNMFRGCKNLISVDCDLDTSNVTNMENMFFDCSSLTSLDVSNWDTSNVTNMHAMFYNCKLLTSLDLSNFDTSKVTNMSSMFQYCKLLTSLDLSNFNTSNVTTMVSMFNGCHALTSLDVSNFNTSNVTDMHAMFNGCNNITQLDVSNFDTSNVTNMFAMFAECLKLRSLDVSNFVTSNVTNMYYMIGYNLNLETLNLNNFKFATNGGSIFDNNISLTKIYINIAESLNNSIEYLYDRTGKEPGYIVTTLRDQIDEETMNQLNAKNWVILPLGGKVKNAYVNGNKITNMITKQNKKIKGIYLGNCKML